MNPMSSPASAVEPRRRRSPRNSSPAARSRWARTGRRMRARSPRCCRPARRSTSTTCRATGCSTRSRRWSRCARRAWSRCRTSPRAASGIAPSCRTYLARATGDAGVRKALILGGDEPQAAGPYADGASLIREGLLAGCGPARDRVAGLPGGPSAHLQRGAGAGLCREARARRGAGPRNLRRHPVLLRPGARGRVLRDDGAQRARGSDLRGPRRPDQSRSRCCVSRSAAASAHRCARCARRAWTRCGW